MKPIPDPETEDARTDGKSYAETPRGKAAAVADDDEPGLSWEEYLDRRRELEDKLLALRAKFVASVHFPRMLYHASQLPRIVQSTAERDALGPGWHVRPV